MTSIMEDGLIKTSSIEQVVAPLSSHLCHLILLCGSETELDEFTQLEAAAKAVAKASKNMAAVATRSVACIFPDRIESEAHKYLHYKNDI